MAQEKLRAIWEKLWAKGGQGRGWRGEGIVVLVVLVAVLSGASLLAILQSFNFYRFDHA